MTYRWLEQTGEMELQIEATSERALFEDALAAFAELEGDEDGGEAAVMELEVSGADHGEQLVAFLDELVFVAETEDFVPEGLEELEVAGELVQARIAGRSGRPAHLVKAVTYHRLEVSRDGDRFRARVVLDV